MQDNDNRIDELVYILSEPETAIKAQQKWFTDLCTDHVFTVGGNDAN